MMFALKEAGVRHSTDKISDLAVDPDTPAFAYKMLDIYEAERCRLNLVDFSDLISGSLAALQSDKGRDWSRRFSHLLVDEFQDTSALQFKWIDRMMSDRENIFCVGDDCQSIYSFRGAVVENVGRFVRKFDATEILLEQNYRCGTDILNAANKLIANNRSGDRKRLWADSDAGQIEFKSYDRDNEEAWGIAHQIKSRGNLERTAVLVRTRAAMLPVTKALRENNILYHVVGAQDFFDRKEIRDAMSLVRLSVNQMDTLSFARAAAIFNGVGKTVIDRIVTEAKDRGISPLSVCASHKNEKVRAIATTIDILTASSPALNSVTRLSQWSGLEASCLEDEDESRIKNLRDFYAMAGGFSTLGHFLEEITLFAEKRGKTDGVTISTIHGAKGLEWDMVYLPALTQGHIPAIREREDQEKAFEEMEEERRLMYVAITRAKHGLYASFSKTRMVHGEIMAASRSIFVKESGLHLYDKDAQRKASNGRDNYESSGAEYSRISAQESQRKELSCKNPDAKYSWGITPPRMRG
jgi:DNA helicase-2/ATP-dependent DNA helicase PcrA